MRRIYKNRCNHPLPVELEDPISVPPKGKFKVEGKDLYCKHLRQLEKEWKIECLEVIEDIPEPEEKPKESPVGVIEEVAEDAFVTSVMDGEEEKANDKLTSSAKMVESSEDVDFDSIADYSKGTKDDPEPSSVTRNRKKKKDKR